MVENVGGGGLFTFDRRHRTKLDSARYKYQRHERVVNVPCTVIEAVDPSCQYSCRFQKIIDGRSRVKTFVGSHVSRALGRGDIAISSYHVPPYFCSFAFKRHVTFLVSPSLTSRAGRVASLFTLIRNGLRYLFDVFTLGPRRITTVTRHFSFRTCPCQGMIHVLSYL